MWELQKFYEHLTEINLLFKQISRCLLPHSTVVAILVQTFQDRIFLTYYLKGQYYILRLCDASCECPTYSKVFPYFFQLTFLNLSIFPSLREMNDKESDVSQPLIKTAKMRNFYGHCRKIMTQRKAPEDTVI